MTLTVLFTWHAFPLWKRTLQVSRSTLPESFKEGGLTPAIKPQIDISTHENDHISATILTFLMRFFLNNIYSSRYVHFRGVLYHLSMFLYPHTGLFEKLSVFGNFRKYHFGNFQKSSQRGYQKSTNHKNTPESSVSERDPTPVKISWKNI